MADDISVMAVLPAGGSGERFGSETPKQNSVLWIKKIVVPIPQKYADLAMEIKLKYNFTKVEFISGMETRHRSIYAGVKQLSPNIKPDDIVIIHDAVRPFLTQDFLTQIVDAAKHHGASGAVRSLVSTIVKSTTDDFLDVSLDRREYRESHTPQAFKYQFIKEAYQKCTEDDFLYGTECLLLVQKYCNISAKLVDGPEYLWKVTHQKDVMLMEHYIKENLRDI